MTRPTVARIAAALAAAALLGACGAEPADQDLCAQYADLKAAVEELRTTPFEPADVDEFRTQVDALRQRADAVRDELDQVQRVSEGRLDTAISMLRQQADDLREDLTAARFEAAENLGPQLTEARQRVSTAYATITRALDTQCPQPS